MRTSAYTKTVVPAAPGFFVIEFHENGDRPDFELIPIVAWLVGIKPGQSDSETDGYSEPITLDCGISMADNMILSPQGTVHGPDQNYGSLEEYVGQRFRLSDAAEAYLLNVEVPRIRAICRLPELPREVGE